MSEIPWLDGLFPALSPGNLPLLAHLEESMIRTNPTAEQARTEPTIVAGSGRVVPSWVLLALVCLGQFMVVLDISIVNVALPSIQAELGFTASGLQWVVNAYTRSEEHTSELQSRPHLVCRLLLEK